MIQEQSYLEVADNSGARKLMCIRVLGGSKKKFAKVGDVIKVTIKEAIPTGRVKKGEVVDAVLLERRINFAGLMDLRLGSMITLQF